MKQTQILDCNQPITGKRIRLDRLGPQHVDFLLDSYSNEGFWKAYRVNEKRNITRNMLLGRLQFEFEQVPGQVGKIEWLITSLDGQKGFATRPLGLACLASFDVIASTAEFMIGFFRLTDVKYALGLESSLLVMDYAYNISRIRELNSYVYEHNILAQKNTLALGFSRKGKANQSNSKQSDNCTSSAFHNSFSAIDFRNNDRLSRLSLRLLGRDITEERNLTASSGISDSSSYDMAARFKI